MASKEEANRIEEWLKVAFQEAERGVQSGGKPFGAIVVKDGQVIGRGHDDGPVFKDPTRHAEVNAIRVAAETLGTPNLAGCILYSSCEPCPMCFGAAVFARIDKVYFGLTRKDADSYGFLDDICYSLLLDDTRRREYCQQVQADGAIMAMEMWKNRTGSS